MEELTKILESEADIIIENPEEKDKRKLKKKNKRLYRKNTK